ncbi:matrixin family metalloprotease [Flavobacterium terrisoli]|uniref:matrixin family metalloprotease n=1 Tax=Flavobacterium terrisoli TaxID=3242195 RepID=UPI00254327D8|nr:matrixin family metalloprotease [Flavobacterium buctense]
MAAFLRKKTIIILVILALVIATGLYISTYFTFTSLKETVVYIQPLGDVNVDYSNHLKKSVEAFYGYECVIKPALPLTADLLAPSKTRYEASKILVKYLSNHNLLLVTEKDIAHHKNAEFPEWGIFGLGFRPGKTCVVSTFRLQRNVSRAQFLERLRKVALHEIGHNLGLDHCTHHSQCMMNDANGTIKQVDQEKVWFCDQCRAQLAE